MAKNTMSYLSGSRMARANIVKVLFILVGAALALFFGFALATSFTAEGVKVFDAVVSIIFLIPAALLLWKGIQASRDVKLAKRYHGIFLSDQSGTVTQDELVRQSGKQPDRIGKDLEGLFRRGFFQSCSLQRQPLAVILSRETEKGFLTVTCPHCGGATRIRVGTSGVCEYCGGGIQA